MGSWYDAVAGTADHLAGSTDEAFARQFDNTEGGGFADTDTYAGIGDHLAGSTDEAFARQFDNTPGGGFADVTANGFWDGAAGVADWSAGETDETVGRATSGLGALLSPVNVAIVAIVAYLATREGK